MIERRTSRSESPDVALHLLLDRIAQASGATALALATEGGRLVAGAGAGARALALVAKAAAEGAPDAPWEAVTGEEDLYARAIEVGAARMYLVSTGAPVRRAREAEASIRRLSRSAE